MNKKQLIPRYVFAAATIIAGIILETLNIGKEFLGFASVGTWLLFVGFVMVTVITLQAISDKKRLVDERMLQLAHKAARVTFVAIIFAAFVIMVWDGINPITIPYSLFMAHFVSWMLVVYFVAYKAYEKWG